MDIHKRIIIADANKLLVEAINENLNACLTTLLYSPSRLAKDSKEMKSAHAAKERVGSAISPIPDAAFLSPNIQNTADSYPKIDLLIINSNDFRLGKTQHYKIKTIINLTKNSVFSKEEIRLLKPFRLNNLVELVKEVMDSQDIFCAINHEFIYDERARRISSRASSVKLTEKENKIFKFMLMSSNYRIKKESLLLKVWEYHENSESLTADTHLYKLKIKLPANMLEIKNNICQLNIHELN